MAKLFCIIKRYNRKKVTDFLPYDKCLELYNGNDKLYRKTHKIIKEEELSDDENNIIQNNNNNNYENRITKLESAVDNLQNRVSRLEGNMYPQAVDYNNYPKATYQNSMNMM